MNKESVEGQIVSDIRKAYGKTYPSVIFALTNRIDALRATGRAALQFMHHKDDCHSERWWPEAECSCGMQEAADELRRAIGGKDA